MFLWKNLRACRGGGGLPKCLTAQAGTLSLLHTREGAVYRSALTARGRNFTPAAHSCPSSASLSPEIHLEFLALQFSNSGKPEELPGNRREGGASCTQEPGVNVLEK